MTNKKGKEADINKVVHMKSKEVLTDPQTIKKLKFGLYKYVSVSKLGKIKEIWFVSIRERVTDVMLELTPYTKVLRYSSKTIDGRQSETIRNLGTFFCMFLNYILIENYNRFGIDDIKDITIEQGNSFLEDYADGKAGAEEKELYTVELAVNKLSKIYSNIKDIYKKQAKNIYQLEWKAKDEKNRYIYISHFKIKASNPKNEEGIFRDMPEDIFWLMLELSKTYYPELTFAIALQAFAGIRPGEVCNTRQAICPIDNGGIKYRKVGDELIYFEVNLKNKYQMRKDLKDVGSIKKKRLQKVYTPFLETINSLYDQHIKILSTFDLEDGLYPMFVNKKGQALTVKSYRDKVQTLINRHLKRELLKSDNNRFRYYGQLLLEKKLSPHFLRHFFTVRLVLDNLPPHMVAYWRGDQNLDTALIYCANKEELLSQIKDSNEKIVQSVLNYKHKEKS